ncbi:integrase-type DNA-binding superfamily protein isoform X2 [Carex rostrata]
MVSIRRRRHLGLNPVNSLNAGEKSPEKQNQSENQNDSPISNQKPFSVHQLPPISFNRQPSVNFLPQIESSEEKPGPSSISAPSIRKIEPSNISQYYPGKEIKRRKRHRRKQYEDQEPCVMRGVYYKNNKWQAAIKVDKKQIHLGTVGSQEEAAHLYDRAAFMCGREPNFELTEEEKEELGRYTWEAFLEMTRNNINNKKQQRKFGGARRKRMEIEAQSDGSSSQSDGTDPDALAS